MDREPDELCENLEAWSSMLVMVLMNHEQFKFWTTQSSLQLNIPESPRLPFVIFQGIW
jgi:hypothetical protein